MNSLNFANRWAYNGSFTEAPCDTGVYQNVVEKILPLSEKHYNQFKEQAKLWTSKPYFDKDGTVKEADGTTVNEKTLDLIGNYRITQKIDNHKVFYMRSGYKKDDSMKPMTVMVILSIVLAVLGIIAIILGICACNLMGSTKLPVDKDEDPFNEGGSSQEKYAAVDLNSARESARQ